MAKFVYRMQNILNIKQKLETQAKMTYSLANQKYLEQQKILQEFKQELAEAETKEIDELVSYTYNKGEQGE